jgi:hypothetical protein
MIMLSKSCRVGDGLHSWNRYVFAREGTVSAGKPHARILRTGWNDAGAHSRVFGHSQQLIVAVSRLVPSLQRYSDTSFVSSRVVSTDSGLPIPAGWVRV